MAACHRLPGLSLALCAGKLTQTFYTSDFVRQVDMADMRMRPSSDSSSYPGRTYRFFTGTSPYPLSHQPWTGSSLTGRMSCAGCLPGWPAHVLLTVAGTAVYPFGHGLSYANFSTQALTSCTGQPGSVRCHLPLLRKKTRRQLRLASVSARQDGVAVTKCLQVGTRLVLPSALSPLPV